MSIDPAKGTYYTITPDEHGPRGKPVLHIRAVLASLADVTEFIDKLNEQAKGLIPPAEEQ